MIKYLVWALPFVLLVACDNASEKQAMQRQIDSLNIELVRSHQMAETLVEVGTLLDSIDASRRLLRIDMVEPISYNDFSERMSNLNEYVKETERKIDAMEASLKNASSKSSQLSRTIARLRADLESRAQEILQLQEQVEKYRNENQNLITIVELQDAELSDKQAQIEAKTQELAYIEARVQELMIQSKVSEADAYYTRAAAVEEAANRTKLAPRKKKETLREAVELYKKALSLGKNEAQAKIEELEQRL